MVKICCFCKTEGKGIGELFKISQLMKEQLKLNKEVIYFICVACLSAEDDPDAVMFVNKVEISVYNGDHNKTM